MKQEKKDYSKGRIYGWGGGGGGGLGGGVALSSSQGFVPLCTILRFPCLVTEPKNVPKAP